ncbi:MAG TPA: Crp/Fnr family transcriptional regulator [Cryomorphaceae bacterium]|nr:Crp/Fnr family transcriptional regulator [Cryomorphaceae bacterium]
MNSVKDFRLQIAENFAPILVEKYFQKGETIHSADRVCPYLFLVNEGVLRAFYFKDGKDITAHFAFTGEAITAPDSFILEKPSKYHIEALEDSRVFCVNNADLENYLDDNPHLEKLTRKFTQAIYLELLERIESLVFLSAKERYELLLKRNRNLLLSVNLGHIASYLGITQETLSRIRAK